MRKTSLFNTLFGVLQLLFTDGQPRDAQTTLARSIFSKPAPTAADLQHMIARLDLQSIHKSSIFCALRTLKTLLPTLKQCARIRHALVKPLSIKGIAQIIMIRNVLARLPLAVGAHQMAQPFKGLHKPLSRKTAIEDFVARIHQVKKSLKVRR